MIAFYNAIALDQIHAFKRNVQARIFGITKEHEFAAASVGFDEAETFKLADAMIDVDDEIAGLKFGEIAEEAGGANFAARAFNGGGNVEEVGIAIKGELGIWKRDTISKGGTNQNQSCSFGGAFGSEAGGGFFGFTENVRDFVFAADVGVAFEFAGAACSEEDFATAGELRFHCSHAGDDIAVETAAGARAEFEALTSCVGDGELFEFDAGGFQ